MSNWLHRLFNPHCPDCKEELMSDPVIEELKTELASLRYERDRLLKHILEPNQSPRIDANIPVNDANAPDDEPVRVGSKHVPWATRRAMLEAEDRAKLTRLEEFKKDQEQAISKMEKELKLDIPEDADVQSQSVKVNE